MIPNIRRFFAMFRTEEEERSYSRKAFYNFVGFLASCVAFSFVAQRLESRQSKDVLNLAKVANSFVH
ncbi:unnamed protein product [Kuraishia capsulata CBS 1993]|uniref:Uncharacterized protein n=1 Tax=Kuraishia capsulata CBS 1993 TaxID=1382522 RepID=W6MWV6_9ASCO|nr:uncharacterized protein KUCA_T00003910001 [Kuraishia capsulata CBS 1993]CDK27930.1 unnamed protein product [Kuraishia capsulata CBS 1993]